MNFRIKKIEKSENFKQLLNMKNKNSKAAEVFKLNFIHLLFTNTFKLQLYNETFQDRL